MAICHTCGNDYDRTFQVEAADGNSYRFDSLECAIQVLAPQCAHCGCRVIGHGVDDARGVVYCCTHCAEHASDS